ncbi:MULTISPECIES: fimbrial protein [Bacteroides]|uniref:fimbrial protein n=1 Tax=Bacteroides TaxID=816 RepID=UPI00163D0B4D|nr:MULTISPECIES: fimbrial protein [Bacteroides]
MKKQNNILKTIKNIIYLTVACTFFNACADDEIYSSANVKEGIPVTINFGLSVTGMEKLTRGLPETEENRINDLYVLVFDRSGKLKNSKFYNTNEIVSSLENREKGTLTLETTSGESRIYAIANAETNELESILNRLDAVKSIEELSGVTISINEANVQRIQGSLVMSGTFNATSETNKEEGYCVIDEHGKISTGKIELSRLDSHITFKIKVGEKVTSFTPTSWQVKYVPLKSNIIEQPKVNSFTQEKNYGNSIVSTAFKTNENDKSRTFDFYMLENIKNSKTYKEKDGTVSSINPSATDKKAEYAKREAEVKNDDETNTGEYKYSEKYATYVEIKAELEIKNENSIDGKRVATVQYRIHLGGGISNPDIFTSKRNTKYTYNLTINDVNDIIVEVEEGKENRPGAEGDVVDSEAEVRTLDAHYNCFIMGFSYNNVVDATTGNPGLRFVVKTPFGDVTEESTPDTGNGAKQDYHWIHFQSHGTENAADKLQKYNKNELIDLFGLTDDVIARYENDGSKDKDKPYYYTVFVDEYYYTEAPKGQNWGNNPTTYWRHFANADNRYIMLVYAPKYSLDGNSSYAKARYMITQRSIQTYYSTEAKVALGMEHINETGLAKWGAPNIANSISSANGLWNTWEYLKNHISWNEHVALKTPDKKMNTFTTRKEAIALARCLSRNRDENGDGKITLDEVKWYVPTSEQLMGMYLGAKSLPTPLYDANNISFVYGDRINYHYTTSDKKRIWSEEGASVGDYPTNETEEKNLPQNFRCVRNLGIDKGLNDELKKDGFPEQAFEYIESGTRVKVYNQQSNQDEEIIADRIFKMTRLTEQNIRGSRLNKGEIALHDNFDDGNKPYKAFQVAQNLYTQTRAAEGNVYIYEGNSYSALTSWHATIRSCWYDPNNSIEKSGKKYFALTSEDNDRSYCKNYSEKTDLSDKGLWRAPNQREMMLIYITNCDANKNTMSRTKWRYTIDTGNNAGNVRFFCINENLFLSNLIDNTKQISLRCVRDVEIIE